MRIECDKCNAKYSIADDKVRGKTFKIRCKKCANVIVVRDKQASPDEQPVDEPLGWHIAIGGETLGPLSEQEVRKRYESGEIDRDTSVWQDGFDDWMPLGAAEAFADLPNLAPASSRGGSDADDLVSPRVSDLTGQRSENSVLFSLENLQKLAGGNDAAPSPSSQPARFTPSTSAPTSEGSGLIDIRSMKTMLGSSDDSPSGARNDDVLPSFAGGGFGGLSAQPLVVEEPPPPPVQAFEAPAPAASNQKSILLAAGIIGIAMMGSAYLYVSNQPQPAPVVAQASPSIAEVPVPKSADEKAAEDNAQGEAEPDAAGDEKAEDGTAMAPGSKPRAVKPSAGGKRPNTRSGGGSSPSVGSDKPGTAPSGGGSDDILGSLEPKSGSSGSESKTDSKASTKPAGDSKAAVDVDCLLDSSLPKCKKGSSSSSGSSGGSSSGSKTSSESKVDPNLPEMLTPAVIKPKIDAIKGSAESCGQRFNAPAGTKVAVRFTVEGSSGTVTAAEPTGEHATTPLGKCVASAGKKAKFPKFQKSSQTFQFGFKM